MAFHCHLISTYETYTAISGCPVRHYSYTTKREESSLKAQVFTSYLHKLSKPVKTRTVNHPPHPVPHTTHHTGLQFLEPFLPSIEELYLALNDFSDLPKPEELSEHLERTSESDPATEHNEGVLKSTHTLYSLK